MFITGLNLVVEGVEPKSEERKAELTIEIDKLITDMKDLMSVLDFIVLPCGSRDITPMKNPKFLRMPANILGMLGVNVKFRRTARSIASRHTCHGSCGRTGACSGKIASNV